MTCFRQCKPLLIAALLIVLAPAKGETQSHIAYLVSDIRIPFWDILHAGIAAEADKQGYALHIHSAQNSRQRD